MRFVNDITLSVRVMEKPVSYNDHCTVRCAFPKKVGKEQQIMVYDVSKSIQNMNQNDYFTVTRGMVKIMRHKFTGKMMFSIHCLDHRVDQEQQSENRWHLSLVLDKRLSDRERTVRWSVCHVYPEVEQFFLELKSQNNIPDITGFRQNDMLIVSGTFDVFYNGITRRPVFSILADEIREDEPKTVPIPSANCFDENELDIANFLTLIQYKGNRSFSSPEEIIENINEFNDEQKRVISFLQQVVKKGVESTELIRKANSFDIPQEKLEKPIKASVVQPDVETKEYGFLDDDMYRARSV